MGLGDARAPKPRRANSNRAEIQCPDLRFPGDVAISFDHVASGDREGELRNKENAFVKIESILDAIGFMGALPFVDCDNLFGLGVCASVGYMARI